MATSENGRATIDAGKSQLSGDRKTHDGPGSALAARLRRQGDGGLNDDSRVVTCRCSGRAAGPSGQA
jgi:hypothetical protein